jgi:tRNA(Ile2)-agmatinylcytidine synthase
LTYLLGIDDTDSRFGHCTTHLGYLVVSELARLGCRFPNYPRLVRLNPNIPFKTRGNAAVCIEFEPRGACPPSEAFAAAERLLRVEADVTHGANSALIMASNDSDLSFFVETYRRAINGLVNYRRVIDEVRTLGVRHTLLGNGMGAVGAAASLGFSPASEDHTYELIAYRRPENCGTRRPVDPESVRRMELATFPLTFNSFDHESGRVLVAPTGPDPVLAGVRGESPQAVLRAFRRLEVGEDVLGYLVYATNQCTDAHLAGELAIPLKAFSAGWLAGAVVSAKTRQGGHLAIRLRVEESEVDCMVYEPSGDLRRVARLLGPGDEVRISGGVRKASSRHPAVLNAEKLEVVSSSSKVTPGTYLPSPRAQRHLTKQLIRYGNEARGMQPLVKGWTKAPSRRMDPSRTASRRGARKA